MYVSDTAVARYDHHLEVGHLRKLGRMAIWNREKIVILLAIGVWLTDVGFLVNGEYLLLVPIKEVFLTNPVISQVAYG
jgi:hypothetical protein